MDFLPNAAAIRKGPLELLVLGEDDVRACLDGRRLLDALADGFRALDAGDVQSPGRPGITVPDAGFLLSMPAYRPGGPIAVKQVSVFDGNLELGLPNHLALITLYEERAGRPVCVMDGTHITGVRTAGAAVVGVDALARQDARTATIVGGGVQAREHLALLPLVRDLERIYVTSLFHEDAEALAATHPLAVAERDVERAVRASDVVCLATHAAAPVIEPGWVRPGAHVSSVGYAPPAGELPTALLDRARLVVEDPCAFAPPPVGCGELQGRDAASAATLGAVLRGRSAGRTSPDEITVYKAMGVAVEDLVAAELAWEVARERGIGQRVVL